MRLLGIGLAAFVLCLSVDAADIPALFRDVAPETLPLVLSHLDPTTLIVATTNTYAYPVTGWCRPQFDLSTNGLMKVYTSITGGRYKGGKHFDGEERLWVEIGDEGHEKIMLYVTTAVYANVDAAQKSIAECMSGMALPARFKFYSCGVGDYCFRLTQDGRFDSWLFSRNNVRIEINSKSSDFSAESIPRQIDADILKRSLEPPSSEEGR